MTRRFANRTEAGRALGHKLAKFRDQQPVILAVPRGGVPVGYEVAKALNAPLDVVFVRKIGAPFQPELAVGAVVDSATAETVLNHDLVAALGISETYIAEQTKLELAEIERRRTLYLGDRPRIPIGGRVAIVVDDGIATGASVRAALAAIRRGAPKRIVLAVPVAPPQAVRRLQDDADEIVCLETPADLFSISQFYDDFTQVSDAEVQAILTRAANAEPPKAKQPAQG